MKERNKFHLDDEQISRAVVDETDLDNDWRRHLAECQICREQVDRLRSDLLLLGEYAGTTVPPMTKHVFLPVEEPAKGGRGFSWLPSFAAAVMAGVVLFVYFLGIETTLRKMPEVTGPDVWNIEFTLEDEDLMDEIFQMVEYPMPEEMYEITGDSSADFDEFMQFVIPDEQDEFQS